MKSKHTPEPWHVDVHDQDADIHSAFGMVACTMGHPDNQDEEGEANARRIVACVNACQSMTTEQLEARLTEGRSLAHMLTERDKALDMLTEQRSELREELDRAYDALHGNDYRELMRNELLERISDLLQRIPA